MAVKLSALRTGRTLLPRSIIIFMFLVLISVRGWVNLSCCWGLKDEVNWKNSMNSSRLEPWTFQCFSSEFGLHRCVRYLMSALMFLPLSLQSAVQCFLWQHFPFRAEPFLTLSYILDLRSVCTIQYLQYFILSCSLPKNSAIHIAPEYLSILCHKSASVAPSSQVPPSIHAVPVPSFLVLTVWDSFV
jgi:hypothetical protein